MSYAPGNGWLNALNYGVAGDGSTNDIAAINAFLTTCANAGAVAFFPGNRTYNCSNGSITVSDYTTVVCGLNATFSRTLDIAGANPYQVPGQSLVNLGNNCKWTGGTLTNTAVLGTATSSNTIGTGSITFTGVTAGLPLTSASFVRVWSRANPANNFEGPVTSYSGTTLVLNATADSGSGTFSDWNITFGAIYQNPITLHGLVETTVESVRVTGNWYVGMLMDGWNPSTGGSLVTSFCTFRNCFVEGVQNRGLYLYGTCNDNLIDGCFVNGLNGITNYGVNLNAANGTGTVNSQSRNKIVNTTVDTASFQGFEMGDQCYYTIIANCTAVGITNAAGVGFLIQEANGLVPQYNLINGCHAIQCPAGFVIASGIYNNIVGGSAVAGANGYIVENSVGTASENSILDVLAQGNSASGISISSGVVNTLLTGRSVSNTGANLTDAGTGTVHTNLITT